MPNERPPVLLLTDLLPDGTHVFDSVWEKSALAGISLLVAVVACAVAWLFWRQLKAERKDHRDDCASKDAELKAVNLKFQDEMGKNITTMLGLINKLEHSDRVSVEILDEARDMKESMKNGLRALGNALNIPSERLNID